MEDETTKGRILARAYQMAGLHGLESLTIGRLAAEVAMSKAGLYGHFGSKQGLQLETIRYARAQFLRDVVTPADAAADGVPQLLALCATLLSYSGETGLHGGDFWVTVFHEYASRTGPVRDAVETTMTWWMQHLEQLVAAGITRQQLVACDAAQVAFEVQALLGAASHQYRLRHDPEAITRGETAILHRFHMLRGPRFPRTLTYAGQPPAAQLGPPPATRHAAERQ